MTVNGGWAFKEEIKGKMKSYGWALIQYDWFLPKRDKDIDMHRVSIQPSISQGERLSKKPSLPTP